MYADEYNHSCEIDAAIRSLDDACPQPRWSDDDPTSIVAQPVTPNDYTTPSAPSFLVCAFSRPIADELSQRLASPSNRAGWTWSDEQCRIFDAFGTWHEGRNLIVRARAGTGKTTTLLEAISRIPNAVATASTLHSAGWAIVREYWRCRSDESAQDERRDMLVGRVLGDKVPFVVSGLAWKLARLGMECAPFAESGDDLADLAWAHECIPDARWSAQGYTEQYICARAYDIMMAALERSPVVCFSDMLYLPVRQGWVAAMYDGVVVDEAQDMNRTQLELATRLARRWVCVVGDDRQGIYAFRGADPGALDRLKHHLDAAELTLTTTYRCGKSIVELARTLVPDYRAHESNPLGAVTELDGDLVDAVRPGSAVLSRLNAPLVPLCLECLRRGIPARVEGRDIAKDLRQLISRLSKGQAARSVPAFLERLASWLIQQVERINRGDARNKDSLIEAVTDKAEMLRSLAYEATSVPELTSRLDAIFRQQRAGEEVVFSSIHKAKGKEWRVVYVLLDTLKVLPDEHDTVPAVSEEANITYVAITRAVESLVWA